MVPSLSCVILAGGRSRRMGKDKALLQLPNGQRLLEKTAEVARALTPNVAIITPWTERYQPLSLPQIHWIKDVREAGPLVGFAQAWPDVSADWCLLLACDLPNLEARVLQAWWQWLQASTSPVEASLTTGEKGWEPLCGYYHRSCMDGLARYLDVGDIHKVRSGDRSFQRWLPTLQIASYAAVPSEMLFNCNRPADWAKLTQ